MEQQPLNQREAKPLAPSSSSRSPPPPPPQPVHQSDVDNDDENVKQLDECSSLYLLMQDCVVRTDRNWKECQKEVQALRECFEKKKK